MSDFQITPIGIVIIAIYSFVVGAIALFLGQLLKGIRWRWWLLAPPALLLLALPWAEEAWIAWHFTEACKDAGVKVYRQVEVEGYLDSQTPKKRKSIDIGSYDIPQPMEFELQGYRFYEEKLIEGGVSHHERVNGQLVLSILEHPTARYSVAFHYQPTPYQIEEPIGWKLEKIERQVVDIKTGEILGRDVIIKRVLPTYEALIARFFGPPIVICPSFKPTTQPYVPLQFSKQSFPTNVLKPILK